ncbi:MAG: hypothetical protein AB7D57_15230 [Desulfovibrionaceae bacterium]
MTLTLLTSALGLLKGKASWIGWGLAAAGLLAALLCWGLWQRERAAAAELTARLEQSLQVEQLLRADQDALRRVAQGLRLQASDCLASAARARAAEAELRRIVAGATHVEPKPGEVVDDATSAALARHLNGLYRR